MTGTRAAESKEQRAPADAHALCHAPLRPRVRTADSTAHGHAISGQHPDLRENLLEKKDKHITT